MENILDIIYKNHGSIDILALTRSGSHLYGTNTPDSDKDYKGVFMPSLEMIYLNRIPKSIRELKNKKSGQKNSSEDIDYELYSFQYFMKLACQGETIALDMLHADGDNLIKTSNIWQNVCFLRSGFYTKNLKSFVGYAKTQSAKYGTKGNRLRIAKQIVELCSKQPDSTRMSEIWNSLPVTDHSCFIDPAPNGVRQYQICGKVIQETIKTSCVSMILNNFIVDYGERARQAERNEGIDWKAISHALRAAYQVKEILTTGTLRFPLAQANFLKDVKEGKLHFVKEVSPILEDLMEEVEVLSRISTFPEEVDKAFWDAFIVDSISNHFKEKV